MPNIHRFSTCSLCNYSGRQDSVVRHMRSKHLTVAPTVSPQNKIEDSSQRMPTVAPTVAPQNKIEDSSQRMPTVAPAVAPQDIKHPNGEPKYVEISLGDGISIWVETRWDLLDM